METKNQTTYYPTIGLEVHAELKTNTKAFCGCKNDPFDDRPNIHVCPVCTAQPGALPVLNKAALDHMVRVGLSIWGNISNFTEFDRKNYFYPDIPKAYQISQYKYPVVVGGELAGVKITRVHLEEDTATSSHDKGNYSLVNYNRAGVPLMELVSEPDIKDTDQIITFAKELQTLLRYLGASDANMEMGQMRVEVNVSISRDPHVPNKKYVEVKNINSMNAAKRAAEYEIARMSKLFDEGREDEIIKETRGWDETKQITVSQRSKENAEDYRYFPEPDLPKLHLHEIYNLEEIKNNLPELPNAKRARFKKEYGIKEDDIELFVLNQPLSNYFEAVLSHTTNAKDIAQNVANYILSDILGIQKSNPELPLPSEYVLFEIIDMVSSGELGSRAAKDILLLVMQDKITDVKKYADDNGLIQKNDPEEIKKIAQKLIDENPNVVLSYKAGKENAIMSLVGKIMKESGGSANPQIAKEILVDLLK
jgi:aspartyl-tRNA(Asn)/glutamyl-tRNA(Gln) amidotransferase subunit B